MIEVVKIANPGPVILEEVARLLEDAGLPACDIDSMDLFAHLSGSKKILGMGGVQFFGGDRVLRSVAVVSSHRGLGIGTAIVKHILAASWGGSGNIYLFTSTAGDFFKKFGFAAIQWAEVPRKIVSSPLVSRHCRAEALPMMMAL